MPKPMTMTIEVEEAMFGSIFRKLDSMPGVVSINLKGEGPKGSSAAPRKQTGTATIACLILGHLMDADGAAVDRASLIEAAVQGGKKASSVPDAIIKLRKEKHMRGAASGGYVITPAGKKRYETACALETEK